MTRVRAVAPLGALLCLSAVASPQNNLANHVTIYRDTYGIPHVFGETDAATAFGFAYAQAEDNFWRIEDNYLRALGRRTRSPTRSVTNFVPSWPTSYSDFADTREGENVSAHSCRRPAIASARMDAANVAVENPHFIKPEATHRFSEPGR